MGSLHKQRKRKAPEVPESAPPAAPAFEEGDVLVTAVDYCGGCWEGGILTLVDPEGTSRPRLWNKWPSGGVSSFDIVLTPMRFRLATPGERDRILRAMKGAPFSPDDGVKWQSVFEQVVKPVIDAAVAGGGPTTSENLAQKAREVLETFPARSRISVEDFLAFYERFSEIYERRAGLAPDLHREIEEDYPWVEFEWDQRYREICDYERECHGGDRGDEEMEEEDE